MVKFYKIKVTAVDYCVEDEDVIDYVEDDEDEDEINDKIREIKDSLPQRLDLEIECEPEDLDDMVCDAVSEETGWLNNSVTYEIVEEN
jgi:hypothetical protein